MTSRDETIEIFFARPAQFGSGRYREGYGSPPFPKGMPTLNEMDKEISGWQAKSQDDPSTREGLSLDPG